MQWERLNPFGWLWQETGEAVAWVREVGASLDPQIVVLTPPVSLRVASVVYTPTPATLQAAVDAGDSDAPPSASAEGLGGMTLTLPPLTETPMLPPTETPSPAPTDTPTPPPTETPTATSAPEEPTATTSFPGVEAAAVMTVTRPQAPALPTPTPEALAQLLPTSTPTPEAAALATPTPTPEVEAPATPTPQIYIVQAGDTAMGIALRFRVALTELISANGFTAQEARLLRPGQQIIIPGPQPVQSAAIAAAPPTTAPPTAAPPGSYYTVRSGDTIIAIASRMGASVESILAANNMTEADARTIRPGDQLLVPAPGATIALPAETPTNAPTPTGTPTLTPSPTRIPPTATPTPVLLRLDAPVLLSPESGTAASCAAPDKLVWAPVQFIRESDRYRLNLGYVSGKDAAGNPIVTWVIQQLQPVGLTQWNMDASLCALAPQELGRQWRWYVDVVEIVDGAAVPVSPPSLVWGFSWN